MRVRDETVERGTANRVERAAEDAFRAAVEKKNHALLIHDEDRVMDDFGECIQHAGFLQFCAMWHLVAFLLRCG